MRTKIIALLLLAFALMPVTVSAQSPNVEFNRWDAQITAYDNSDQLQVAETQEIHVIGGSISQGARFWTTPVNVQNVFVVSSSNTNPQELVRNSNGQPGTYNLTQSANKYNMTYALPTRQASGSTFVVQINYTTTSPTTGMVDWKIVPAEHDFVVKSSTVHVHFPNGETPDVSLVRASQTNANVQVNGNEMIISSAGELAPGETFAIQVPFGAGVGAAGNSNGNPGGLPPQTQPGSGTSIQLPGLSTLLPILCIVGILLLVGGGSLLRNLLGGFLGGGGNYGGYGGSSGGSGGTFGGGSNAGPVQRGFRQSGNQDRPIGRVGNDKDSGGGASFR